LPILYFPCKQILQKNDIPSKTR